MSHNADATLAWKILAVTLRTDIAQLKANSTEQSRLEAKEVELRNRIIYLETAIETLGGDLAEARKP